MKKVFEHKIPLGDTIYNSGTVNEIFSELPDLTSRKKLWYITLERIEEYDPNFCINLQSLKTLEIHPNE